jgi:hypothetical protein
LHWAYGVGMTRLPPQPPDSLDQVTAFILEPEVPPEATNKVSERLATSRADASPAQVVRGVQQRSTATGAEAGVLRWTSMDRHCVLEPSFQTSVWYVFKMACRRSGLGRDPLPKPAVLEIKAAHCARRGPGTSAGPLALGGPGPARAGPARRAPADLAKLTGTASMHQLIAVPPGRARARPGFRRQLQPIPLPMTQGHHRCRWFGPGPTTMPGGGSCLF